MKLKRICKNCGESFEVDHWEVTRKGKGAFCGRPCVYRWLSIQNKKKQTEVSSW